MFDRIWTHKNVIFSVTIPASCL